MTFIALSHLQHRNEDFELDPPVLTALWRMEDRHFWHAARNRFILRALAAYQVLPPATVLDVGCGGGCAAAALNRAGYRVTGIDTGEVLVRKAHERSPGATFIAGHLEDLPPRYAPFDAIAFFDVFEHLDDPLKLLQIALGFARPGTRLVATVPALGSLHSVVDDLSGHKKRYEPGELAELLRSAGLDQVVEHGIFRSIFPVLKRVRKPARAIASESIDRQERRRILIQDTRIPTFPLNHLLKLLCTAEAFLPLSSSRGKVAPTLLAVGQFPGARA